MITHREDMNIVIVGHVDHGKSTIIGRLLADTGSLPDGKLESVKERCRRNSKPFEYAFLLDALKDEQEQGITIDSARCFFKTIKRDYIIIDAPGHIEFLRNMVTGASRADAALLVIDAKEGIKENSKRHGYLLSMLGINQIIVLVNKMDLVDYDEEIFNNIVKDYSSFLRDIKVEPTAFIPVSGFNGVNITEVSKETKWFKGQDVLSLLDSLENKSNNETLPLRIPVQGVYKFTRGGDDRRIVAGTITSGVISRGDEVVFYPSGKSSKVKTIETLDLNGLENQKAGYAVGFTLEEQIYVRRGEVVAKKGEEQPLISDRIIANIFWLGKNPLITGKEYLFKIGSSKQKATLEKVHRVIDASDLGTLSSEIVQKHEVAEVVFKISTPIAYDIHSTISDTSRFVIVDDYEISGGGIITDVLDSKLSIDSIGKEELFETDSTITSEERYERYGQIPSLIMITADEGSNPKPLAQELEKLLFNSGRLAYYIDALKFYKDSHLIALESSAHNERLSEIINVLIDAGHIVISTGTEFLKENLKAIEGKVNSENIINVHIGEKSSSDEKIDRLVDLAHDIHKEALEIKSVLKNRKAVFQS